MSLKIKRSRSYHTGGLTQVEQERFDGFWRQVLAERGGESAIFSDEGSVLRTFRDIEEERAAWHIRLSGFSKGDGLVAAIGNDPSWPAFLLACWDRGLVIAPIKTPDPCGLH